MDLFSPEDNPTTDFLTFITKGGQQNKSIY